MNEVRTDAESLERILSAVMRAVHRNLVGDPLSDLPVAQLRLMRSLGTGDQTPSVLAEQLSTSVSAVTQMANRLEAAGMIEREEDTSDRRVRRLRLSAKGSQLVKCRREHRIQGAEKLLAALSADERHAAIAALEKLASAGTPQPQTEAESLALTAELEGNLHARPEAHK